MYPEQLRTRVLQPAAERRYLEDPFKCAFEGVFNLVDTEAQFGCMQLVVQIYRMESVLDD